MAHRHFEFSTRAAFSVGGAKILSARENGVEVFAITSDGRFSPAQPLENCLAVISVMGLNDPYREMAIKAVLKWASLRVHGPGFAS